MVSLKLSGSAYPPRQITLTLILTPHPSHFLSCLYHCFDLVYNCLRKCCTDGTLGALQCGRCHCPTYDNTPIKFRRRPGGVGTAGILRRMTSGTDKPVITASGRAATVECKTLAPSYALKSLSRIYAPHRWP